MAQTTNDALRDALIRHQIYLLRYSVQVRLKMTNLLDDTERDLASKIRDRLRVSKGLRTPADVDRMRKLMDTIKQIRGEAWTEANSYLEEQMRQLAVAEPVFMAGLFGDISPVELTPTLPPDRQLIGIATARPFEGRLLSEWADAMELEDLRRIQSAIQMGMIAGESADEIAARVLGTRAFDGREGVTEITRRNVEAIVRTAVQSIANTTRDMFFDENADVIEAEMFVATLDSRTTPICRALDGKRFPQGEGPKPPLHFACRSIRVAVFDGEALGKRPAKAGTRREALDAYAEENDLPYAETRDDLPRGTKSDYDKFERRFIRDRTGQVPAALSYNEWLKTQTNAFQDEVMGPTRAKLFREGNLALDKYVTAAGTELTLSQLAQKYPDAFKRAGLDINKYIK